MVGRFASPVRSREVSPDGPADDSSDSDAASMSTLTHHIAARDGKMDPNDADDEAEGRDEMHLRGRSRKVRPISVVS